MTPVDWLIAAILVASVLAATRNGLLLEVFSLSGALAGFALASWNYRRLLPWVERLFHSRAAAEAVSFLLIVVGVMLVGGLLGRGIRWAAHSVGLGWADRSLGALVGIVKGLVLSTVAVLAMAAFFPQSSWVRGSRLAPYFLDAAHQAASIAPAELEQRIHTGVDTLQDDARWVKPASTLIEEETRAGAAALKAGKEGAK